MEEKLKPLWLVGETTLFFELVASFEGEKHLLVPLMAWCFMDAEGYSNPNIRETNHRMVNIFGSPTTSSPEFKSYLLSNPEENDPLRTQLFGRGNNKFELLIHTVLMTITPVPFWIGVPSQPFVRIVDKFSLPK